MGTSSAKCVFGRSQPKFLRHIIDQEGIRADPDKTSTITEMKPPTNVSKLGCFMGMDNQHGKFSSNLAELSGNSSTRSHHGFGVLTKTRVFTYVQKELAKPTVLALYNPHVPTKVCADASSYSL